MSDKTPSPEVQAIIALCHHPEHHTDCTTCEIRATEGGAHLNRIGAKLIQSLSQGAIL